MGLVYQVEFKCTGVYTGYPVAPHPVGVVDSVSINGTAELAVDIGGRICCASLPSGRIGSSGRY